MSEIKVDALTGKTSAGDITVTSEGGAATMQLQQGLAKMWAFYRQGLGASQILYGSLNVTSLTDAGTGETLLSFVNQMNNATDNAISITVGSGLNNRNSVFNLPRTNLVKIETYTIDTRSASDCQEISTMTHGDLA
jgi:hypothetical protein